jgi:hypothetical protein
MPIRSALRVTGRNVDSDVLVWKWLKKKAATHGKFRLPSERVTVGL